ncbi:putative carbohydrate esterase [Citrus sinensis]|uniref:Carbohydrate esterase n=1 Tax=Citrus sinensis TaxID=2711 RepID=A0ACB8KUU2_CITSI|nr:putative carbohydrate esterase [Citrus sinensis]
MNVSKLLTLPELLLIAHSSLATTDLPKDIFILTGQSNMAGRGGINGGKWRHVPAGVQARPRSDQGWRLPMNYEPPPGSGSRFGVVGLVPCMGESDTIEKEDADGYKGSLARLILYLRSDLNTPSLPFIQVAQALEKGNQITECKM